MTEMSGQEDNKEAVAKADLHGLEAEAHGTDPITGSGYRRNKQNFRLSFCVQGQQNWDNQEQMNSEYLEAKERKKPVVDLKLGMLGWGRPRCRCPGTWHTVYKQLAVTQWLVCIHITNTHLPNILHVSNS